MAYFLDVFSPETYETFSRSPRDIAGFKRRYQNAANNIHVGDKLICYMTIFSRWIGVLEVTSDSFLDETPIYSDIDPYVVRFKVKPLIWLEKEKTIPIKQDHVWSELSFTRELPKNSDRWTARLRSGPNRLNERDGQFLETLLRDQLMKGNRYPLDEQAYKKFIPQSVKLRDKTVAVSIPETSDEQPEEEQRESTIIQALIAEIGSKMGMRIWLPRNDRGRVLSEWQGEVLEKLPLSYDDAVLKTIEQIDVLWIQGRRIVRAFEIEHTTKIYSGILRMADLLTFVPHMPIKIHIVAPEVRRSKVFQEIHRPVFSALSPPLTEVCTFISYDDVRELANEKHLNRLSDEVLDDYAEVSQ